jgi:hypothetical protein
MIMQGHEPSSPYPLLPLREERVNRVNSTTAKKYFQLPITNLSAIILMFWMVWALGQQELARQWFQIFIAT